MQDFELDIEGLDDLVEDLDSNLPSTTAIAKDKYFEDVEGFLTFPDVEFAHLYFMVDFEFHFETSLPYGIDFAMSYFNDLAEKGLIGKVLQSSKSLIFPERPIEGDKDNFVIIPISKKESISGLIFLKLKKHWGEEAEKNLKLVDLIAKSFHYKLQNEELESKLNNIEKNIEQRISEKIIEISKSKNDLNVILNAIQAGVLISEENTGKIVKSNPIAREITGYNELELNNKKIYHILKDSNSIRDTHYEAQIKNSDQELVHVMAKSSFYELTEYKYRVDSFIDISDMKFAQELLENTNQILESKIEERTKELEQHYEKLRNEVENRKKAESEVNKEKELHEIKSKFLKTVSHEFRSPLTIIRSSAEILNLHNTKLKEEDLVKYSKRIVHTSDYLTNVLQNILFVQYDQSQLVGSGIDKSKLLDLIDEVINKQKTINQDFDLSVNLDIPFNYEIQTNKIILQKILNNIIDNARIYKKDIDPILIIDLEDTAEYCKIRFWDNGIGIPEKDIEKVGELFFRGSNVGPIPGVGLGIAVIKHNLKLLGGSFSIESQEGAFTEVNIKINKKLPS